MISRLLTIQALSPLHCGVGQGLGDIDLPTARNPVSGHPVIPGSSIKGVLKDEFIDNGLGKKKDEKNGKKWCEALFGKASEKSNEYASAISISDASLLALPVRSFFGTFAWIASPYTLELLKTSLARSGKKIGDLPEIPTLGLRTDNGAYKAIITENSLLRQDKDNRILLEEMDLLIDGAADGDQNGKKQNLADEWADIIAGLFFDPETQGEAGEIFRRRFAVVDDNALNFCCECGLPVDARIAIDETTGTVKDGALWYEETVPMESLFIGMAGIDKSYREDVSASAEEFAGFLVKAGVIYCQIGGKATAGKGFSAVRFQGFRAEGEKE